MIQKDGNDSVYSSLNLIKSDDPLLLNKRILFLGSSVTFGAASQEDGIPEYFRERFSCRITKEAVSGTTLLDNGPSSYVSRLKDNVDPNATFDLVICQLSTNDASRNLPLGAVSASDSPSDQDPSTVTGAMEYIIAYCKNTWHCPVAFYTGSRFDSENYQAMVQRLYELSYKWKIGVLDLWSDARFNDIPVEDRVLYMADPVHPKKAGYMKWWCPELEKQLLKFLENK